MNPIRPTSVALCNTSNTLLPPIVTLSYVDMGALRAARCAARSLFTRCSSVSPTGPGLADAVLDLGCGVVDVKRVASLALRGPDREDIFKSVLRN